MKMHGAIPSLSHVFSWHGDEFRQGELYLMLPQDYNFPKHYIRSELLEIIVNILLMVKNNAVFFLWNKQGYGVSHAHDKFLFTKL
jgi:hypothetical protein